MSEKSEREYRDSQRRIIQIDQYISSGCYPTASFLADKLERSVRTIQRDIEEMILEYQAPIASRPGVGGYYYTEPNFFLKSVMLSEGELFSIALFDQLLEQYRNTPLEENLRNTFEKITACLPENISVDSTFLKSNITFIPDQLSLIDLVVFETVFKALEQHQTLEFNYRPLQKTTFMPRKINPYHAVCQKGAWYILGYCHDKQEVRIFNFSRIQTPKLGKKFNVPSNFRPEDYFDKELGIWLSAKEKYTVELLIDKEIGTYALDRKFHSDQDVKINEDGSVYVKFDTTQLPEVKRWVLGQGKTVKVLGPEELKCEIVQEITSVLNIYK